MQVPLCRKTPVGVQGYWFTELLGWVDGTNETSYWFLRALSRSAAPIHSHYMYVLPPFLKRGNFLSESMVPGMAGF